LELPSQDTGQMERPMRQTFPGTSAGVTCVLLLTNTSGATVVKGFVMIVLFLVVGRTARALGPFIDDSGRLLRDCVVYLRKGLRQLFGQPQPRSSGR